MIISKNLQCESEDSPSPDQDSGQSSTFNSTRLIHDFVNEEEEEAVSEKEGAAQLKRDPSPDYNTSRESLIEDDEEEEVIMPSAKLPPPLPPKKSKPAGSASNTMSKAQSDATGNFLLVRR